MIGQLTSGMKLLLRIIFHEEFSIFANDQTVFILHKISGNFVPYSEGIFADFNKNQIAVSILSWKYLLTAHKFHKTKQFPFKIVLVHRTKGTLLITERKNGATTTGDKFFSCDYLTHLEKKEATITLFPFVMHSSHYDRDLPKIDVSNTRTVRVFFSGNSDPRAYSNEYFRDVYGILSRHSILETLRTNLEFKKFISFDNNKSKPIWLLDWQWNPEKSIRIENRIPNNEWLHYLSNTDFFLCCPGVNMPMCHNTIEAMACGAIPIIEYPNLFHPKLEDDCNYLVFKGKNGLLDAISRAMSMSPDQIRMLRTNVIEYYAQYLHPTRLRELLMDPKTVSYSFLVNVKSLEAYLAQRSETTKMYLN